MIHENMSHFNHSMPALQVVVFKIRFLYNFTLMIQLK